MKYLFLYIFGLTVSLLALCGDKASKNTPPLQSSRQRLININKEVKALAQKKGFSDIVAACDRRQEILETTPTTPQTMIKLQQAMADLTADSLKANMAKQVAF